MSEQQPATTIAALIDEHYQLIYRYAYRLCGQQADAEDLTQQTFLAAQSHWEQLREPAAAKRWLCSIVRNAFLQGRRRGIASLPLTDLIEDHTPDAPASEIDPEDLQQALAGLPEEFQTPLILFYFRDFGYKEIAATMNVPVGTIMSRLSRGKTLLRKQLSHTNNDSANIVAPTDARAALTPKK